MLSRSSLPFPSLPFPFWTAQIIVGACKPSFLEDPNLSLFRVHPSDGRLSNMDNALFDPAEVSLAQGKVFQGGNYNHLHHLLGKDFIAGPQLMYVGDHMFSDVIRGKRTLGWRTMLVVPELAHEVDMWLALSAKHKRIEELRELTNELDEWVDRLSLLIISCENEEECQLYNKKGEMQEELEKAIQEQKAVKLAFSNELRMFHEAFHPVWGQIFKVCRMALGPHLMLGTHSLSTQLTTESHSCEAQICSLVSCHSLTVTH